MNQVKSMSQRRPFNYRNNRNGRNPMRSLRNPIGDDEQSLSASGTFTYFSGMCVYKLYFQFVHFRKNTQKNISLSNSKDLFILKLY